MKNYKIYYFATLLLFLMTACQKDDEPERFNFALQIADHYNADSKIWMDGSTPKFIEDEAVRINGETYLIDHRSGSPTVYDVAQAHDHKYYAVFPASWVDGKATATPNITFPATQTYRTDATSGHQVVENPMVAYATSDGGSLSFRNVAALANVHIYNGFGSSLNIKYITIYTATTPLSGPATISDFTGASPRVNINSGGVNSVTIDCSGLELTTSEEKDILFALPPITNVKLYVKVYMTDAEDENVKYIFTKETVSGKTIGRNQMGTINVNLSSSGDDAVLSCGSFWGSGTSAYDPFLITCQSDLEALRTKVKSAEESDQTAYNTNSVYYLQTDDIPLSSWAEAIGTSTYAFHANYDGGQHSITNLSNPCGLFAYAGSGSIKNLTVGGAVTLTDVQDFGGIVCTVSGVESLQACTNKVTIAFTPSADKDLNGYGIGGCVGRVAAQATLNYCANEGSVLITACKETNVSVGGILGRNESASTEIKHCFNKRSVGNTCTYNNATGAYGGICGNTTASIDIENCNNEGYLQCWIGNNTSSRAFFGGMLGKSETGSDVTIKECENSGRMRSYNTQYSYFGGMLGYATSTTGTILIEDCKNYGSIMLPNVGTTYVGGMAAYVEAGGSLTIKDCINGKVIEVNETLIGVNDSSLYAQSSAAGMCAYSAAATTIESCNNYMKIRAKTESGGMIGRSETGGLTLNGHIINKGDIAAIATDATTIAGGIVGNMRYKINVSDDAFVENYGAISGGDNLGGIIARIDVSEDSYVRRCINYGTVTDKNGATYGTAGIIGDVRCASSTNGVFVRDCGNEGAVSAVGYASGVVGYIYSNGVVKCTIQNCYCDADVYGGSQTAAIFVFTKRSGNALTIIADNCYYNGSLTTGHFKASVARQATGTPAADVFRYTFCYSDATSTPTPRGSEPTTSGTSTYDHNAARTFTAPTGAYANKGASISAAEWSTDSTLLKVLNYRAESEGYASWTQPSHTVINEETGDETVVIDKLPRLVLTTPTSKRR